MTESIEQRFSSQETREKQPTIALEHQVKKGETILQILKKQKGIEDPVVEFIKANQLLEKIKPGDKIQFEDHWSHYIIKINGKSELRKDWKERRFFKSYEARKLEEKYDKIKEKENEKSKEEEEMLKQEIEIQQKYKISIEKHENGYSIIKNNIRLDMNFKNLQAIEDAGKIINKIESLYNNEFNETERPEFYHEHGELKINNRLLFDTTYLKNNENIDKFLIAWQNKWNELPKLAEFLNKTIVPKK